MSCNDNNFKNSTFPTSMFEQGGYKKSAKRQLF